MKSAIIRLLLQHSWTMIIVAVLGDLFALGWQVYSIPTYKFLIMWELKQNDILLVGAMMIIGHSMVQLMRMAGPPEYQVKYRRIGHGIMGLGMAGISTAFGWFPACLRSHMCV